MASPIEGPFAWHGDALTACPRWQLEWSRAECDELDQALAAARRAGLSWPDVGRRNFPLARVAKRLAQVAEELERGRGLVKLSGLPVGKYAPEDLKLLWFGLACHLGRPVFQDSRGQLMREIRDEGGDLGARHGHLTGEGETFLSSKARTYGPGELRFHTDRCDVVSLLAVGQAGRGGLSKVASAVAVHNAILATRPDLHALLCQPYPRSRLGEEEGGAQSIYQLPVFGLRDGQFTSHYSRTYIEAAQLVPGAPPLSEPQWQALDLLAASAERLCLEMRLEPGEMQFLNNHVIYHARTAFEDDPSGGRQRLLYRVWLAMANSRALPEDHAVLWGEVAAGARRGGIGQTQL